MRNFLFGNLYAMKSVFCGVTLSCSKKIEASKKNEQGEI
jgi:hypothetical protein